MWTLWFGLAMAQDVCVVEQETADGYRPRAAETQWAGAGGWDGKRFKGLSKELRKDFKKHKRQFAAYPADAQEDILAGRLREDLDEVAAWLAWGAPSWTWKAEEKGCRHLLYADRGPTDVVLSTCDGQTQALYELGAPISCERLDSVVPRIEKKGRISKSWEPEQMVAALAGIPQTWMARDDLDLVFGKPDSKREKGTVLTYLDDDGLHEGPTITLEDERAATWSFPERKLLTRSGERELRKEARAENQQARSEQLDKARKTIFGLLNAAAVVGMAAAEQSGATQGGTATHSVEKSSYSRHVRFECNDTVLYDQTFTDREACLRAQANTDIECMGHKLPFGC